MKFTSLIAGVALISTLAMGAGSASAQMAPNPNATDYLRTRHGSNQNIEHEIRRIGKLISSLENDQNGYGGHKARAIDLLQKAQAELRESLQYRGR